MSSPTSIKLLEDRIKFKFHAAKEHLKNLKCLEAKGEDSQSCGCKSKVGDRNRRLTFAFDRG
jgi:hypothetical protein